jgi:hypothetical protein
MAPVQPASVKNIKSGATGKSVEFMKKISRLLDDVSTCLGADGPYKIQCSMAAIEKFARTMPYVNKMIYPWRNFNWDYLMYTQQNYDPIKKFNASPDGTISALTNDINALIGILGGLLFDANPSDQSRAADPSSNANDLCPDVYTGLIATTETMVKTYETIGTQYQTMGLVAPALIARASAKQFRSVLAKYKKEAASSSCSILSQYRTADLSQKAPYKNSFFDKPITGKHSSSYFAQVGICETEVTDEDTCNQKEFIWVANPSYKKLQQAPTGNPTQEEYHKALQESSNITSGTCFRGKYAYMDNEPGYPVGQIKNLNGLIPSIIEDLTKVSPDKMVAIAMGQGVPGFALQHCDESFINGNNNSSSNRTTRHFTQTQIPLFRTGLIWDTPLRFILVCGIISILLAIGWYMNNDLLRRLEP